MVSRVACEIVMDNHKVWREENYDDAGAQSTMQLRDENYIHRREIRLTHNPECRMKFSHK